MFSQFDMVHVCGRTKMDRTENKFKNEIDLPRKLVKTHIGAASTYRYDSPCTVLSATITSAKPGAFSFFIIAVTVCLAACALAYFSA